MERLYFTKKGFIALQKKAEETEKKLADLQSQTAYVAEVGGNQYHDNASYELLIVDIRAADFQLGQLRESLNRALIVEKPTDESVVTIGTRVRCVVNGVQKVLFIRGHGESDPETGKIAYDAPLANLILRSEEGDIKVGDLSGRKFEVEILRIELDKEGNSDD